MSGLEEYVGGYQQFIKICGVTKQEDAALCAQLGVSAVGILIEQPGSVKKPHSMRMSLDDAAALVAAFPGCLLPIMLVHATDLPTLLMQCDRVQPRALQIQTALSIDELASLKNQRPELTILRTFRVLKTSTVEEVLHDITAHADAGVIDGVLLDAEKPGHGLPIDWNVAATLVARFTRLPIILAGGLDPENVQRAIQQVRPFGVDVMTAVKSPLADKKEHAAIRAFVSAVRSAGGTDG